MLRLTDMHKITVLQMIGYRDNTRTQMDVGRIFHETFLDFLPITQGAISKIEKQFRRFGHVRQIKKAAANAIRDDTKLDVMLEFEENPHTSSRQAATALAGVNSALTTFFFGPNLKQKLTIEKFLEFQKQLQKEILSLEFQRKHPDDNGLITEPDFTDLLLAYSGFPEKKKLRMMKRVKKMFRDHSKGISRQDYLNFFHFLNNINDVDTALTFYHIAGASIDEITLKHVAKTVAHVDLTDHIIHVVFTVFDENQDGQLSNREFIAVMKNRLLRGLEKPKDTGFVKFMHSVLKCAKESTPSFLDI